MTPNWKTGLTVAFDPKIYFCILGLGLESVALALHVFVLGLDISDVVNIRGYGYFSL